MFLSPVLWCCWSRLRPQSVACSAWQVRLRTRPASRCCSPGPPGPLRQAKEVPYPSEHYAYHLIPVGPCTAPTLTAQWSSPRLPHPQPIDLDVLLLDRVTMPCPSYTQLGQTSVIGRYGTTMGATAWYWEQVASEGM